MGSPFPNSPFLSPKSTMSTTFDLEAVSIECLPSQAVRKRTVSENLDHKHARDQGQMGRKTQSVAQNMVGMPRPVLTNQTFLEDENVEIVKQTPRWRSIPCKGIVFIFLAVILYQGGSVIAKKLNINPILMILFRDLMTASFNLPFVIKANKTSFPKGKRTLVVIRGMSVGLLLMAHFYAVRYLPMADVMMISSIKPIFITLLSCIFLKEDCGVLEIMNLLLVMSGIFLVVQPAMVFGSTAQEYNSHMQYTAIGLVVANAQGGVISVIIRYLKDMHWAPLAISTRIFGIVEMFGVCLIMGVFCIPECGFERVSILVLAAIGLVVQLLCILALKFEEAHVIGLVDSVFSIVVAVLFQITFFAEYPNALKTVGACLVLSSVFLIGGKKIMRKRRQQK